MPIIQIIALFRRNASHVERACVCCDIPLYVEPVDRGLKHLPLIATAIFELDYEIPSHELRSGFRNRLHIEHSLIALNAGNVRIEQLLKYWRSLCETRSRIEVFSLIRVTGNPLKAAQDFGTLWQIRDFERSQEIIRNIPSLGELVSLS
jgi:hypothetical protein